jgi:hypothetical protein
MYSFQNSEHPLTVASMTTNAIRESYMFVRLSDVTKYGPAVKFKLDGQLGDHQDIASVVELPDESWELVVHRLYFTDLYVELTRQFADCCVNAEYDPTEPSPAELEHYSGKHSLAKQAKRYQFLCRAASMAGSWPIAATYYNLRAEEIRAA